MKPGADIVVYSPDGTVQLVVEVKSNKNADDNWAAKLRRNLLAHAAVPRSRFFLIALPRYFYLWRGKSARLVAVADYKVPTVEVLGPYLGGLDPDELGGESFRLLVRSWLTDLLNTRLTREAAGPELQWLFDSGLYEAIRDGSMETKAVA